MSGVATDPPTGRDATTWTAAVAALVAKLKVAAAFGGETTFDAVGSRACADEAARPGRPASPMPLFAEVAA